MSSRKGQPPGGGGFWRNNALSVVLLAMFLLAFVGQAIAGHAAQDKERAEHGQPKQTLAQYLDSGSFASATFENWESEFLQMGVYVLLTVYLRQRGSAESRPMDEQEENDIEATERKYWSGTAPRLSRATGFANWFYRNSLSIVLLTMFALSFVGHALGSWRQQVEEEIEHGRVAPTLGEYLCDPQLWFESLQNWQSEFLAVLALVVLSIWLRQAHSPQSKPVDAPHRVTGS